MDTTETPPAENELIYEKKFSEPVTIAFGKTSMYESEITVGPLTISDYHSQDCCENVYADFSLFEPQLENINKFGIVRMEIRSVEDMGILFFFYDKDDKRMDLLVNCYNEQNGYYSDELSLVIAEGKSRNVIDVSNAVPDSTE